MAKEEKPEPFDAPTLRGCFSWVCVGDKHLPCLIKSDGTKYVSVKMAECKVLSSYLNYLNSDVCSCYSVKSFSMSKAEADLLNEINSKHADALFGNELFTASTDFIVKLDDLLEFYTFILTCYRKLLLRVSNRNDRCGFVRINGDSVVPYTVKNNQKYVPLFYFEGETDSLRRKAEELDSWDLAYLKFCCKVQGIKNELFASETCLVTSLEDIKSYFPDGTTFEDYWPTKNDMQMPKKENSNSYSWIQAPHVELSHSEMISSSIVNAICTAPVSSSAAVVGPTSAPVTPVAPSSIPSAVSSAVLNRVPNQRNANIAYHPQNSWPPAATNSVTTVPPHTYPPSQRLSYSRAQVLANNTPPANSRVYMLHQNGKTQSNNQYYNIVPQTNNNMVHQSMQQTVSLNRLPANAVTNSYNSSTQNRFSSSQQSYSIQQHANSNSSIPSQQQLHQMQFGMTMPTSVNSISRSNHTEKPARMNTMSNKTMNTVPSSCSSSFPTQASSRYIPELTPINGMGTSQKKRPSSSHNQLDEVIDLCNSPPNSPKRSRVNNVTSSGVSPWNLTKIDEVEVVPNVQAPPQYKVQKSMVKKQYVPTINFKPYMYSELLMTVTDLLTFFFPGVSIATLQEVLQQVLKVNLYAGNTLQMKELMQSGKCESLGDTIPLILVNDVDRFYPQLNYVLMNNKSNSAPTSHPEVCSNRRVINS